MRSPTDVRKIAEKAFASGLYCAESTLISLAEAQGIESDLLPGIATGFCSGMARTCGTCFYCRTGEYNLCPERLGFGYGIDGVWTACLIYVLGLGLAMGGKFLRPGWREIKL